ncbi:MAG: thymidine phosphorylase [Geothrix sp.]|uniref:thymidine phosphorylase n=1 Tax=Geothrix sp. TaxID=1962974 RepID=UPI0017E138F4|nr:thymidine phosphorylase [Geothrix sp.]NWJ40977.1 thymidine phosphorylase [Geothrix sp.]WIL21026.1 MAG: thymidine phosphorylase [Geothrix sp.]
MRMYDLIYTKKLGGALSAEQIAFWVKGAADGSIPDEQSASLLMAICWRGMSTDETLALTLAMRDSGKRLDLSPVPGLKVDKHSTGGVGDKTTLILGPIVAACGVPCPMFSGRGLGHTGGTVDKFAAIPGLKVELSEAEFIRSLAETRFANSAQTANIAPADKKLYALRDVTATVESIPLITASIMSKKLAGGADALVLDVKCGPTAFMKTLEDATTLAQSMVDVGTAHGMQIRALITRMDAPLGWAIGNALEVMESVEILRGEHGDSELAEMSFRLAAEMLIMGGVAKTLAEAQALVQTSIQNGSALETLRRFVALNGGDAKALDDFSRLPQPGQVVEVRASQDGYLAAIDGRALGILAMDLGAGRRDRTDVLDLGVGIRVLARVGQKVAKGDLLFQVLAKADQVVVPELYLMTLELTMTPPKQTPWLMATIGC